jgi:hypothetical protein
MSILPDRWPGTIREINDLPLEQKQRMYFSLIPDWAYTQFGIDSQQMAVRGTKVVQLRCPTGSSTVELALYDTPSNPDPALYIQLGDTFNSQLSVLLVIVNDPQSPRFAVDVDAQGRPNQLGTLGRNIPEEICALQAGLAPGQVRRGLRIFRSAIPVFEQFIRLMGHDLFFVEPLFYHNAITFERYGFAYSRGQQWMHRLHQDFSPGGKLNLLLDDSSPFRSSSAWQTVRGRSWAIHDGLLGQPFTGVQMYKRVDVHAGVETFLQSQW